MDSPASPSSRGALFAPLARFRRVRHLLGVDGKRLAGVSVLAIISALIESATLLVLVRVATAVAAGDEEVVIGGGTVPEVTLSIGDLIILTLALAVLRWIFQIVSGYAIARLGARSLTTLRRRLMHAYLDAGWAVQSTERQSELVEVVSAQSNSAAIVVITVMQGITQSLRVVVMVAAAVAIAPVGAVAIVVAGVVVFLMVRPLTRATKRHAKKRIEASLALSRSLHETSAVISEARVFGVLGPVRARADRRIDSVSTTWRQAEMFHRLVPTTYQLLAMVALIGSLTLLYNTGADATAMGAVIIIMVRALAGTQGLTGTFNKLYELTPLLDLIEARLDRYHEGSDERGDEPLDLIEEISIEHLSYSYGQDATAVPLVGELPDLDDEDVPSGSTLARLGGRGEGGRGRRRGLRAVRSDDEVEETPAGDDDGLHHINALADISFEVRRGEAVGVVGPSGSGKSTLVQILLGLRSPTDGRYLVNGRDARDYLARDWYADLALVPQHPHLIEGTVAENIAFFRRDITQADIERAARLANVHDEILTWSDGYDTPVAERGTSLSGGQRQRVSLARAFAGKPSLLILDEPTSALDMQSEALIRDALAAAKAEMTLFVVAHRLSTLNVCDRIMVLKEGRLEHFAPAAELLASNDFYREAVELSRLA
jgi:ABC-type multidrug transport system fused ATPase/permease subunit